MPIVAGDSTPYKFTIDPETRLVTIPKGFTFGVFNDRNVQTIVFEIPRYYRDIDLSEFTIRVNFAADDEGYIYLVTDPTVTEDTITFNWTVDIYAYLQNGGYIIFSVCLRKIDGQGNVTQEFNTAVSTLKVIEGLEVDVDEGDIPVIKDYLAQIVTLSNRTHQDYIHVSYMKNEIEEDIPEVREYATQSRNYRDEAKNYRDQAAAIVTPEGLAARVLALEDLGFFVDEDGYIVQEADD